MMHETTAVFHPIALVRRVNLLHGFVFFYPIPKIPYQNRITNLVIIDADITGTISIVSKSKLSMKEVFL